MYLLIEVDKKISIYYNYIKENGFKVDLWKLTVGLRLFLILFMTEY